MDEKMSTKEMYQCLQAMREEAPVDWAVIIGKRTVPKIAEHLIMTPAKVEREVERLVAVGGVRWGQYMGRPLLQIVDEDMKQMADFAWRFRMKVMGKEDKVKK